jgi:hypothetical protein
LPVDSIHAASPRCRRRRSYRLIAMTPTTAASGSLYRAHGHLESVSWRLALAGRKRARRVPHPARDQGADVTGESRDHEQSDVAAGRQSTVWPTTRNRRCC